MSEIIKQKVQKQLTTVEKKRIQSASETFIRGGSSFYNTYFSQLGSMSISKTLKQKMESVLKNKQKELEQIEQQDTKQSQQVVKKSNGVFDLIFLLGITSVALYATFKSRIDTFVKTTVPKIRQFIDMFCSNNIRKIMDFIQQHKLLDKLSEGMSIVWTGVSGLLLRVFDKISVGFDFFLNDYNDYYQDNIFVFLLKSSIDTAAKRVIKEITLFSVLEFFGIKYNQKLTFFPDLRNYLKYGHSVMSKMKQIVKGAREATGTKIHTVNGVVVQIKTTDSRGWLVGDAVKSGVYTSWAATAKMNALDRQSGQSAVINVAHFADEDDDNNTLHEVMTTVIDKYYKKFAEDTPKEFNIDGGELPNPFKLRTWEKFEDYWNDVRKWKIKMFELDGQKEYKRISQFGYIGDDKLYNQFIILKDQFQKNDMYKKLMPLQWRGVFFTNLNKVSEKYRTDFGIRSQRYGNKSYSNSGNRYYSNKEKKYIPFTIYDYGKMLYVSIVMTLMKYKFDKQISFNKQLVGYKTALSMGQDGKLNNFNRGGSVSVRMWKQGKQYERKSKSFIGIMVQKVNSGSISGEKFLDWVIDNKKGLLSILRKDFQWINPDGDSYRENWKNYNTAFIFIIDNLHSQFVEKFDIYYYSNGLLSLMMRLTQYKQMRHLQWLPQGFEVQYGVGESAQFGAVNLSYAVANYTNLSNMQDLNSYFTIDKESNDKTNAYRSKIKQGYDVKRQDGSSTHFDGYKSQMALIVGILQGFRKVRVDYAKLTQQRVNLLEQLRLKLVQLKKQKII